MRKEQAQAAAVESSVVLRAQAAGLRLQARSPRAPHRRARDSAERAQSRADELVAGARAMVDGLGALFELGDVEELASVRPILELVPPSDEPAASEPRPAS